jgi:hypothetical protein
VPLVVASSAYIKQCDEKILASVIFLVSLIMYTVY